MLVGVAAEVVAVQLLVRLVEPVRGVVHQLLRDGTLTDGHPHLEGLAEVAEVGRARVLALRLAEAFVGECAFRLGGERVQPRLQFLDLQAVVPQTWVCT